MARAKVAWLGLFSVVVALMLALAACAPTTSPAGSQEPEGGSSDEPAVTMEWSADSNCMSCHTTEAESMGDASTLYSLHSQHATMNACIDCHGEDLDALAKAHENYASEKARIPTKLKKTDVTDAVCTTSGCHVVSELVELTADVKLVDSNGTEVNPHSMVGDPKHGVGGTTNSDLTCVSCHEMHAEGSVEGAFVLETANNRCTGCHHHNVYECYTCHE